MAIIYDPGELLQKIAPPRKLEKLMTKKVTLKKTALSFVDAIDFIDRDAVVNVALKVVRSYQERIAAAQAEAGEKTAGDVIESQILDDPKLLIQRVQNEVIFQVKEGIKKEYAGESYEWLPSDAGEPDPEHALLYGTVRIIGDGEMPGDRDGCRCGMRILVKQTELELR